MKGNRTEHANRTGYSRRKAFELSESIGINLKNLLLSEKMKYRKIHFYVSFENKDLPNNIYFLWIDMYLCIYDCKT